MKSRSFSLAITIACSTVAALTLSTQLTAQPASVFTTIYTFPGGADGANPGGLIQDKAGILYGTTAAGGGGVCNVSFPGGCGVVFKLNLANKETVLYSFTGGADGGGGSSSRLVGDQQGNLYGTRPSGGLFGHGVVFKLDPANKETVLYSFTGGADGGPGLFTGVSGLVRDQAGNLYGTTAGGGAFGQGVAFKVDPTGKETVLYSFTGGADGGQPYTELFMDQQGNLYGTTPAGGDLKVCGFGCGVVFKVDPAGKETVLHTFTGGADGADPAAPVLLDKQGNLFGTTALGGEYGHYQVFGVLFELDTKGKFRVLHDFSYGIPSPFSDGVSPEGGLVQDSAGNLYGTTTFGGTRDNGVVFEYNTTTGKETVLYSFQAQSDGGMPAGQTLVLHESPQGKEINLYGTVGGGDGFSNGVVFRLTVYP
ncbi:MAG TPA: choice-of-anchor tandem repeat GloVer-containing protein [Acidisarcina sp.]